jgi:hypothetical protein
MAAPSRGNAIGCDRETARRRTRRGMPTSGLSTGREPELARYNADDEEHCYSDAEANFRDDDRPINYLFKHPIAGGLHDISMPDKIAIGGGAIARLRFLIATTNLYDSG